MVMGWPCKHTTLLKTFVGNLPLGSAAQLQKRLGSSALTTVGIFVLRGRCEPNKK